MVRNPVLIQGGMGVGVSSWRLAREVSMTGNLGVVSGVALDLTVARRLQDGDPGGHLRRALAAFPLPEIAQRVVRRYFVEGGRPRGISYRPVPKLTISASASATELTIVANFVEVWLAKSGHDGVVGINYLEKIQLSAPAALYGAMLAHVDYVLVGAGIPTHHPGLLDRLSRHEPVRLPVSVAGSQDGDAFEVAFQPFGGAGLDRLPRPKLLAIVSAHVLAAYLARDPATTPDGFVVEGPTAGGHSAPPRGALHLDEGGEPIYGPRDYADLQRVAALGLPFWLAGGYGTAEQVRAARRLGAAGVQVGTPFALCLESGLTEPLRTAIVRRLDRADVTVRNDPRASPTGFPFKVVQLPATLADAEVVARRERLCDLGYLRTPYRRANGRVGYRCAAEPVDAYVRKGGDVADTVGRLCLCNGLSATIGLGQHRPDGYQEPSLVTLGADIEGLVAMHERFPGGWTARELIDQLECSESVELPSQSVSVMNA